tara:strand:+ start:288 stop:548 length:261 start_codon:yes stop_codon:yes gene_type:complete
MTTSITKEEINISQIQYEIEDCEEEIMLAEVGIKETTRDLEELKETLSFYQEDLTYEEGRMVELLEKQNQYLQQSVKDLNTKLNTN